MLDRNTVKSGFVSFGLVCCWLSVKLVTGAEPPANAVAPAATTVASGTAITSPVNSAPAAPLSRQRRERRQKWEAALQSPANLTLDDAETITLGELLTRIRAQHGLAVRIDLPQVLPMAAMAEITTVQLSPKTRRATGNAGTVSPAILPYGVAPTYSTSPPVVPDHKAAPLWLPDGVAPAVPSPVLRSTYKPFVAPEPLAAPVSAAEPANARFTAIEDALKSENSSNPPVDVEAEATGSTATADESSTESVAARLQLSLNELMRTPVAAALVVQPEATVEDLLRQVFDRTIPLQSLISASLAEEGMPFGASLTRAMEWDLLVQDDGVLLTTRLNANLRKETRVYSVRAIEKAGSLKAEEIARVVTRTVRPWSWRTYAGEAKPAFPASTKPLNPTDKKSTRSVRLDTLPFFQFDWTSLLSDRRVERSLLQLTSEGAGTPSVSVDTSKVELTPEDLELLAQMWNGLFQGTVTSLQVIHHADPPTGVLEVLPGLLVISQSQGAHREIADLLEQLANPEN